MTTFLVLSHVLISLVAIAAGLAVVYGWLIGCSRERLTTVFLVTTILTSAGGFLLPATRILPSHIVGVISLVVLGFVLYARPRAAGSGGWRKVFVIGSIVALYLNVFVAVVQSFLKIPALKALAPTQAEPPFQAAQAAVLLLFVVLGFVAVRRQRTATPNLNDRQPSFSP